MAETWVYMDEQHTTPDIGTITTAKPAPPEWMLDMKFCHLLYNFGDATAMCGYVLPAVPVVVHQDRWEGEALCEECGRPMCPQCVVLEDLEMRAKGDS